MLKSFIHSIDALNEKVGRLTGGIVLLLVLIIVFDVGNRYLFHEGSVALQELQWHLFSLIFLLGAAYTLKYDAHVRVDMLYQKLNDRQRLGINLFGHLFLLIPFCLLVIKSSWPFVYEAFKIQEISPDSGGLPYRFLLKAAIPIGFGLLMLQGISQSLSYLISLVSFSRKIDHD